MCAVGEGPVEDIDIKQWSSGRVYIRRLMPTLTTLLAQEMRNRSRLHDLDTVIVIDGKPGSGKSSLAVQLAKAYCGDDWRMEDSYAYDANDVMQMLDGPASEVRGRLIWLDEASNVLSARDSMTIQGRAFSNIFDLIRAYNLAVICCMPWWSTLDRNLRTTGRIAYRLHCGPTRWTHGIEEIGTYELQRTVGEELVSVAYGRFPSMDPETDAAYRRIKDANLERRIGELKERMGESPTSYRAQANKAREDNREAMLRLYERTGSYDDICAIFGVEYENARQQICRARKSRVKKGAMTNEKNEAE